MGCIGTFDFLQKGIKRLSEVGSDEIAEEEFEGEGPWGGLLPARVEDGDSQMGPLNGASLLGSPTDGPFSDDGDSEGPLTDGWWGPIGGAPSEGSPLGGTPLKALGTQIIAVAKKEAHSNIRITAKEAIEKGLLRARMHSFVFMHAHEQTKGQQIKANTNKAGAGETRKQQNEANTNKKNGCSSKQTHDTACRKGYRQWRGIGVQAVAVTVGDRCK